MITAALSMIGGVLFAAVMVVATYAQRPSARSIRQLSRAVRGYQVASVIGALITVAGLFGAHWGSAAMWTMATSLTVLKVQLGKREAEETVREYYRNIHM